MNKKLPIILLAILLLCVGVIFATTFSSTYDTATPAGSDDPAEADDRMREIKAAVQERENVDHYWPLTGTEVSDADVGEHRKILFHAPIASTPTVAANHGDLRIKDVCSVAELHWTDEDENELQITSGGALLLTGARIPSDTYIKAIDATGTGTVDLIKADVNDVAVLPDGTKLATSAAPTADSELANKKYVDDNTAVFGTWTNKDSGGSLAIAKDSVYQVGSDGFITGYGASSDLKLYTDSNNPPTTLISGGSVVYNLMEPIKEDDYFKFTATGAQTIYWLPMGSGTCVKQ